MDKLTVRRLTRLAEYMEKLPKSVEAHFDMGGWFRHEGRHCLLRDGESPEKEHYFDCGTSACALGWAATMPYFKKAGLRVIYYDHSVGSLQYKGRSIFSDNTSDSGFLNLDGYDSMHLFGQDSSVKTPKQWAKRCRKFLRTAAKQ